MSLSTAEESFVVSFINKPDWEDNIGDLNKEQLTVIAKYFQLSVPSGVKKGRLIVQVLQAISKSRGASAGDESDGESELKLKVRFQELELEKIRLQEAGREKEREHEYRMSQVRDSKVSVDPFNINNALKLLPIFQECNVSEFFIAFEKVAKHLQWPSEYWTTLVQCRLIGKAQKVYTSLGEDVSTNYETVKSLILKAYDLVPEAYRQKFRELEKSADITYVEFSRNKEQFFNDWLKSVEVNNFDSLKELILVEEFKNCIPRDMRIHLEELKLNKLQKAAVVADEYVLTHKDFYRHRRSGPVSPRKNWNNRKGCYPESSLESNNDPRSSEKEVGSRNQTVTSPKRSPRKITCFSCGRSGHVQANCFSRKRNEQETKESIALVSRVKRDNKFSEYMSEGHVSSSSESHGERKIKILRDTGAAQSLILRKSLPVDFQERLRDFVVLGGFPNTVSSYPLEEVYLRTPNVTGLVNLAVVDQLPVPGVDVLLANDLAVGDVELYPIVSRDKKVDLVTDAVEHPVGVITRAKSKAGPSEIDGVDLDNLPPQGSGNTDPGIEQVLPWDSDSFEQFQKDEFGKVEIGDDKDFCKPSFQWINDILYRVSRASDVPTDEKELIKRIVVPSIFRDCLIKLSHDSCFSGHLGVTKTLSKLAKDFYWPGMKKDVKCYVSSCVACQKVGKPNQKIPKAPLIPIPSVGSPFSEVIIDVVGPLPKTPSGHEYILTLMDKMSRYPEAVPLRTVKSEKVIEVLVNFFTKFGLPKVIQTDCGSNFTSRIFKRRMKELGIRHVTSSPYHPESQGKLERFHQTLKSMLKKFCLESGRAWDKELPYALFSCRSMPTEMLGLSPFQLIFGHNVRGPLDMVREHWEGESLETNVIDYISGLHSKMQRAWAFFQDSQTRIQKKMKRYYDLNSKKRSFSPGDSVLVLLPTAGNPLKATFSGPWKILKKVSDVNYVVETPERRKKSQLCHINMLKPFLTRKNCSKVVEPVNVVDKVSTDEFMERKTSLENLSNNSEQLKNLHCRLEHLDPEHGRYLESLISEYKCLFTDSPGRTHLLEHDVDVGDANPIKQYPYRLNPMKKNLVEQEVEYMMKHDLIQVSDSPWSSPVVLVKKEDGQFRLCFDYRKVNAVTKTDSFPLPRVEDCVDRIGSAEFITKLDLLKGYWQVKLTDRARTISAFVTDKGLFECKVMPFGMKNAAATFQRLMGIVIAGLEGCVVYIDDLVVYSDDWSTHLQRLRALFTVLSGAGLVINLKKCEFAKTKVIYLGHEIGLGCVAPKQANVQSIVSFPVPSSRRDIRKFLGMTGYYRKFIRNFSEIANPLTELLKKNIVFRWSNDCQKSFEMLKSVLITFPVLRSPDFSRPFQLTVDASDIGVGAVLTQNDDEHNYYPVAYHSKKLSLAQRKYSTIEKETLALILAIQHFEVYLSSSVDPIIVWTDHNPLVFINRFQNKNSRIMRWGLFLQEWNLNIKYVKGKDNVVADALSRYQD